MEGCGRCWVNGVEESCKHVVQAAQQHSSVNPAVVPIEIYERALEMIRELIEQNLSLSEALMKATERE